MDKKSVVTTEDNAALQRDTEILGVVSNLTGLVENLINEVSQLRDRVCKLESARK